MLNHIFYNLISINMINNNINVGSKYMHFKGNEYKVLYIAKHTETLEDMVVYQALYGDKEIWVRPLNMFIDNVFINGLEVKRFKEII